ncbi:hypothetical protein PWK10_14865 [Caloramator sp. Dgby_cultured_2]|uniref:hypothetical protein n=1 Tax=Caloramator sp. Dgby_cultured_2 TaxID=3029174 RepID=UPI00237ED4F3|nr:hypothetical protein [Caloramator sp. Dgby_cultured_2]WDU82783.1 hypothetical protein PWK10_14865 [Caloramator sp. Dgby_cultured_2]
MFSPIPIVDRLKIDFISLGVKFGVFSRITAIAPEIIAEAMDVPDLTVYAFNKFDVLPGIYVISEANDLTLDASITISGFTVF